MTQRLWFPNGLMKLMIPPIIAGVYVSVPLMSGYEHAHKMITLLGAYIFPPLGKESVIPMAVSFGIDPALFVSSIIVLDFFVALFVFWNYELIKRISFVGNVLDKIESKSHKVLSKKWFGKIWWIGLILFMVIPLQGSGAISTTILGRVLAAGWKVLLVVIAGSAISSASIGFASNTILTYLFGI